MTGASEEYLEKALSAAFALAEGQDPPQASGTLTRPGPIRLPERVGRYPVEALVGRGGIGLVLRAHDTELDRRIAVKVLHEHLASDAEMVRRFVEEAQVGGALEHPGVVPVHEIGRLEDGRPFFTMKLVEGETFAAKLAARKTNTEDRLGFLSTFEKVCQIVAYAHSRNVVHLDLKPANILVGGFGEILVTDWGFASNLSRPEDPHLAAAKAAGSGARIVGTPAYMSPEQARGDLARIGPRSDVFALGAMLCEILTGTAAYGGDSATELLLAASRAWLEGAWKRLDECGADGTLVALARRCLAPEPGSRPADAGEVADVIGGYLRSLDERAQVLAIEAAEARTRAVAERRQRRLVVALTAVGVLVAVVACGAWLWIERDRAAHARADDRLAVGMGERVRLLAERARASAEPDPAMWDEPSTLAHQAVDLARTRGLPADLRERLEKLAAATDADRGATVQDDRTLKDLMSIHERVGDNREWAIKDREYAQTFRGAGIDVEALGAEKAAALIAASPIRGQLVSALDEWAHARRNARNSAGAVILVETANRVDPDLWRVRVRTAAAAADVPALLALAAAPERESEPAESQIILANNLKRAGRTEEAAAVLEAAERLHPDDYSVHHELGMLRRDGATPKLAESIRQFSMALALRPKSAHAIVDLGQVFLQSGDSGAAERLLQEARRRDPAYAPAWYYLGAIRLQTSDLAAAEEHLRKSVDLDPGWAQARAVWGAVLQRLGRADDAANAYRECVKRDPTMAEAWCELGQLLKEQGRFAEARDCLRKCHETGIARGARWTQPTAEWLDEIDRLIEAEKDLTDLGSELPPMDDPGRAQMLAEVASLVGRPLMAARIMDQIFSGPASRANVPFAVHLFAARAAASAGTGGGKEKAAPADAAAWRDRALGWLRAALDSAEEQDAAGRDRELVARALDAALRESAFAGVREPARLSALAPEESKAWNALWERLRRVTRRPESR